MAGETLTLESRSAIAAADSAGVTSATQTVTRPVLRGVATLVVSTTGSPTTYALRVGVEASADGGTTWHQVLRFTDVTNAATPNRICRFPGAAAATEAAFGLVDVTSAAASATIVDGPWPALLRVQSKLNTLSGGTAPTLTFSVTLQPAA